MSLPDEMPDDSTLERIAAGDGSMSEDVTYAGILAAEVLRLRSERDALRAQLGAECLAHASTGRKAHRLEEECAGLRGTLAWHEKHALDARTVAPTEAECAAHLMAAGGRWLVAGVLRREVVQIGGTREIPGWVQTWIALGRDGVPCAWPEGAPDTRVGEG